MHTLPDGTRLQAGRKATKKQQHGAGVIGNERWATVNFSDTATMSKLAQDFAYDANGNRLSLTEDGNVHAYTYQAASNRLTSTAGPVAKTYSYDAAGNVTSDGFHTNGYDDRGRLVDVDAGQVSYQHNGQGERVIKDDGAQRLFAYDEVGQLIGEYDALGVALQETVYFSGAAGGRTRRRERVLRSYGPARHTQGDYRRCDRDLALGVRSVWHNGARRGSGW